MVDLEIKYSDALDYTTSDGTAATFYPAIMHRVWCLEETYGADVALARDEIPGFLEWLKDQVDYYAWEQAHRIYKYELLPELD